MSYSVHQEFAMSKFVTKEHREKAIMKALEKEREKVKELEKQIQGWKADQKENIGVAFSECGRANKAEAQLVAAQATIEQMREALVNCDHAFDECKDFPITHDMVIDALNLPTNLDALHEARAQECERLRDIAEEGQSEFLPESSGSYALKCVADTLTQEAAAHRAKKGQS